MRRDDPVLPDSREGERLTAFRRPAPGARLRMRRLLAPPAGLGVCLVALLQSPAALAAVPAAVTAPVLVEERITNVPGKPAAPRAPAEGHGDEPATEPEAPAGGESGEPKDAAAARREKLPPLFRAGLLAGRSERSGEFEEFTFRLGFDRLDPGPPGKIELLAIRLRRHGDRESVRLEEAMLFDVAGAMHPPPAGAEKGVGLLLAARLGAVRLRDNGCPGCLAWVYGGGAEVSRTESGAWPLGFFLTLPVEMAISRDFRGSDVRVETGVSGGLEASWLRRQLAASATASWRHVFSAPGRTYDLGLGARWFLGRGFALDARATYYPDDRYPMTYEATVGLLYYFGPKL